MIPLTDTLLDGMWRGAIMVLPLALLTTAICRQLKYRPGARHALWLTVLMGLVISPFLPTVMRAPPTLDDSKDASHTIDAERETPIATHVQSARSNLSGSKATQLVSESHPGDEAHTPTALRSSEDAGFPVEARAQSTDFDGSLPEITGGAISQSDRLATQFPVIELMEADATGIQDKPIDQTSPDVLGIEDVPVMLPERLLASDAQGSPESFASFMRERFTGFLGAWRHWIGQLATARDALGGVSPIPASLWMFGAAFYALTLWINALRMSRLLKNAVDASPQVRRLVSRVAKDLGLRRVPQCIIVPHRVSPMIWCGLRQRLVLPADLWEELDTDGRVAVITHELAHLRRRDHWVRWIDAVVGCVYWWHPVVWWVRSRISAEAENCCDAWVTWLNPRSRRAYAEALLTARGYISSDIQAVPAVGMGAGTRKSRTFARRLTMIMTRKDAPGMSAVDWAFALVVVTTGWLATPARSDAPVAPDPQGSYGVVESDEGVITVGSVTTATPVASGVAQAAAHPTQGEGNFEDRLDRLERRMSKLMELMESRETRSGSRGWVTPRQPRVPSVPTLPYPQSLARREKGATYSRAYKLPSGKLEALTALMSRDDVPVLISPGKDAITVNGTSEQHAVFARFLSAIGDEQSQSLALSGGKLEALSKLMIRSDVPIRVAPGKDHIKVIGSPGERQAVFDFIKLIKGQSVSTSHSWFEQNNQRQSYNGALDAYRFARQQNQAARRQAILAEQTAMREHLLQLRNQASSLEKERESMERVAEQLREREERIRKESERSRERLEKLRERRERAEANPGLLKKLASTERIVANLEDKIDAVAVEANTHETHAEELASKIEMLETQADALEDVVSELGELAES